MRNTEYTALVLSKLREGKNEKQIALETQRHRNTVSRHVNWLRRNFQAEPQLITNEILQRLRERVNTMTDRDLVRFLSVLMPQKIESKMEIHEIKLSWEHHDSDSGNQVQSSQGTEGISSEQQSV